MRTRLSEEEIDRTLASPALAGWTRKDDAITRTFEFGSFRDAMAFVQRAADAAEAADHHPDIDIRYTRVTCVLSTHSAGGLTELDVQMARTLSATAPS